MTFRLEEKYTLYSKSRYSCKTRNNIEYSIIIYHAFEFRVVQQLASSVSPQCVPRTSPAPSLFSRLVCGGEDLKFECGDHTKAKTSRETTENRGLAWKTNVFQNNIFPNELTMNVDCTVVPINNVGLLPKKKIIHANDVGLEACRGHSIHLGASSDGGNRSISIRCSC